MTKSILEIIGTVSAAFGIMAPPESFLAGLFFAIAGSSFVEVLSHENSKTGILLRISSAIFISILAASLHASDVLWLSNISIQIVMLMAGVLSVFIIQFAVGILLVLQSRTDELTDTFVNRALDKVFGQKKSDEVKNGDEL